ncbi:MAG: hypothetical protein Q8Q48_01420 [Candidatus Staskawiczbacteria bacterium]|nr:hypothetical protein [Candidatus Staskawiczbacteria bacterium]
MGKRRRKKRCYWPLGFSGGDIGFLMCMDNNQNTYVEIVTIMEVSPNAPSGCVLVCCGREKKYVPAEDLYLRVKRYYVQGQITTKCRTWPMGFKAGQLIIHSGCEAVVTEAYLCEVPHGYVPFWYIGTPPKQKRDIPPSAPADSIFFPSDSESGPANI